MPRTYPKKYDLPEPTDDLKLTRSHIALLDDVCRFGLIDSALLCRRHSLHPKYLRDLLLELAVHKYIGRPRSQEKITEGRGGSVPLIVGPLPRGSKFYNARSHKHKIARPTAAAYDDTQNWNRSFRERFTTTATEQMFEEAAANLGIPFAQTYELISKYAAPGKQTSTRPLKISTNVPHDRTYYEDGKKVIRTTTTPKTTNPDGYMLLGDAFTFHESDEGTETVVPGSRIRNSYAYFHNTSLLLKLQVYAAYFRLKHHQVDFGIKVFRVLVTTTKAERALYMANELKPFLCDNGPRVNPGFALFIDRHRIEMADNNPYAVPAYDLKGREVMLVK